VRRPGAELEEEATDAGIAMGGGARGGRVWSAAGGRAVTVIRAGTLIDGVSGSAKANQIMVIRGNRIESVATGAAPAGAKVIDLSGQWCCRE
jgi:hypothetical protein